jgi:outer membrane immunogenic protein
MKSIFLITAAAMTLIGLNGEVQAQYYPNECYAPEQYYPCNTCCSPFEGWYVGGNIGWGIHDRVWTDRDDWVDDFGEDFALGSVFTVNDGVIVGAQTGYNFMCGCALFGLEVDFDWADLHRTKEYIPGLADSTILTLEDRAHWFGTIRGRAGITADNLLLYATAGAAWAYFKHDWTLEGVIGEVTEVIESYNEHKVRWGLALGTGVEWAFCDSISIKAEGLYLKFPERTISEFSPIAEKVVNFDLANSIWIARVGVNFKLCHLGQWFL